MARIGGFLAFAVALCLAGHCLAIASSSTRTLLLGLRHRNLADADNLLWQISDPRSPSYAQYLSREQLKALMAPHPEDVAELSAWLKANVGADVARVEPSGDFMAVRLPSDSANALRNDLETAVPKRMRQMIDVVLEANNHMQPTGAAQLSCNSDSSWRAHKAVKPIESLEDGDVLGTPGNQKAAYGIPQDLKATNPNSTQLVWGPCTYGVLLSDIKQFFEQYNVPGDVSTIHQSGYPGVPGGDNFGEATLDTSYIAAMGLGATTIVSNTNNSASTEEGQGFGDALLNFLSTLANADTVPPVISLSLGSLSWDSIDMMCTKVDEEGKYTFQQCLKYLNSLRQVAMYTSEDQVQRINTEFMKLGLRGVSILAATGDGGSHFSFVPFDDSHEIGRELNKISCKYNMPTFPAASPYVTGVGGIQWQGASPQAPIYWSAGGGSFSWRFPMPSYQSAAVADYLQNAKNLPPSDSFNATLRAYPDVAALALNVPMVMQGQTIVVGGTSAAAPEFAGVITLINDYRFNHGLPPLGFLNPRLYQTAADHPNEAFYDVTVGNTKCASNGFCCGSGFPAADGWDAATGLGSPLFPGLLKYLGSDGHLRQ